MNMKIIAPILVATSLAMVCFTDPQGLGVWVDRSQVVSVSHPIDCTANANTRVTLSNGMFLCIREKISEALGKLRD